MVLTYLLLSSLLVLPTTAFTGSEGPWTLTDPVGQSLQKRANYEGSWALAIPGATCPSEASVKCKPDSITLDACCPSGDSCFGLGGSYCCPTKNDCKTTVTNFPSCFNETWTLYKAKTIADYFCCPPGQYGVLPLTDYGGICQYNDVAVDSSRTASVIEQLSTRTNSGTSRATATNTNSNGEPVTTGQGANPTGSSGQGDNANSGSTSSSNQGLSAGAIAGIVIGALGVLALFLVAFMLYRRGSKKNNTQGAPTDEAGGMQQSGGEPTYTAVPQSNSHYPLSAPYKSPATAVANNAPTAYPHNPPHGNELPSPANDGQGPYEVPVWEGRGPAELGSNRG